jgi:hypothetical protein
MLPDIMLILGLTIIILSISTSLWFTMNKDSLRESDYEEKSAEENKSESNDNYLNVIFFSIIFLFLGISMISYNILATMIPPPH